MAVLKHQLDIKHGFDHSKDKQHPVGFITALKIGETEFKADMSVMDPTTLQPHQVVAVLSYFEWDTTKTGEFHLEGHITTKNQQAINTLLHMDMTNIHTDVHFAVHRYDQHNKKYFKSIYMDAPLKAVIEKHGGQLTLAVANDAHPHVQSPMNYHFIMACKPQPIAQQVNIATAHDKKLTKQAGVEEK